MLISLDFDEVLFPFMGPFLDWLNPRLHTIGHNSPIKIEDPVDYKIHSIIGLENTNRLVREFYYTPEAAAIQPEPGSVEIIKAMMKLGYEFVVTTGRPEMARESTTSLLNLHFPAFPIHFCNQYEKVNFREKADVVKSLGALAHVDDQIPHVNGVIDRGLRGVWVKKPWPSTDKLSEKAWTTSTWGEIWASLDLVKL